MSRSKKPTQNQFDDLFADAESGGESGSGAGDSASAADFARMFEDHSSGISQRLSVGDRLRGEILTIGKEDCFVSTGTMNDGVVLRRDLLDSEGKFNHKVGDFLDLYVVQVKGSQILLSPKPTSKNLADDIEDAFDMELPIEGKVTEVVNGGFRVQILGQTAFCPISQMDTRRIEDSSLYIGKKFEFRITQFEKRNLVVSRRRLLEAQKELSVDAFMQDHRPGDTLTGVVTRLENFGAFIEVAPGLEGLAHISEVSWSRVAHPQEAVQLGQQVQVKILKIEEANGRLNVALSVKQAMATPWENLPANITEGSVVEGKVTRCMKFGAFVEVAPGIEGLVPLSEMSYTKRVLKSDEIVKEGERVSVLIKEIRLDERRLLLSVKDAGGDPWAAVEEKFPQGAVIKGRIERREPYGLFVKLEEGVTGLLPKSKAMENADFPFEKLKIGDDVTVQVAEVRLAERRISLGVPQDPDAELWKGFAGGGGGAGASSKSLGTFGEQFKGLFEQGSPSQNQAKKMKK
jgi:small subunit ribosomal protein S1